MSVYPTSVAYAHGSATSAAAATSMVSHVQTLREGAVTCLKSFREGLTADEIAVLLDVTVLAMRPRITELVKEGTVFAAFNPDLSPLRRVNASGRTATVWRI